MINELATPMDIQKEIKKLLELQTVIAMNKELLNINDVCVLTGLSKSTIYKLTASRKIKHFKQAKHLYFNRTDIESWLRAEEVQVVDETTVLDGVM